VKKKGSEKSAFQLGGGMIQIKKDPEKTNRGLEKLRGGRDPEKRGK